GGARWRGVDRGGPGPYRHAATVWRNHHPEQGLSTMADQLINQVLWPLIYILCIVLPLVIAVAMFVYWERKVIGWMHVRLGPNKIGPFGMLQAFADVVKLLIKEVILPTKANRFLYFMAPLLAL